MVNMKINSINANITEQVMYSNSIKVSKRLNNNVSFFNVNDFSFDIQGGQRQSPNIQGHLSQNNVEKHNSLSFS